ncbi:MAG: tetratricopeptide repeat protein, partial [Akkermansia sp.]
MKKPLVIMAAVAGTFVLCQCSSEAPPPPGTVRMVDQKAISLMQEARGKEEKNDLSGAIKKYKRVVEKHPLSREAPQARFRMAELYEARKDPAEAFDQYQKLIDRHPDSPLYAKAMERQKEMAFGAASGALTNRVLWMFDVRMDPRNVTEWLNHVRDNAPYAPSAPQAMNVLGNYLATRGRMKEAIEAYQNLVDNHPDSPLAPTAQLQIATLY